MTLDIRAKVTSNLGDVISANISDDYIQGSGLIKTSGSCEIKGLVRPVIGSTVQFYYTKSGITRSIPRRLRVLSFFADPYRKKTSIELGCKLTYLQDLRDPIDWTAFDDTENSELTETDQRIIIAPIHAQSVMDKCLSELSLTATSSPLTNKFSIETFDFSSGYVDILGNLLVSEGYCGYLDEKEVLQIVDLGNDYPGGPVLTDSSIVDISPINVGELPGDAVVVSYNTLKLKLPDNTEVPADDGADGEDPFYGVLVDSSSSSGEVLITYQDVVSEITYYRKLAKFQSSVEQTTYERLSVETLGRQDSDPARSTISVVTSRRITEGISVAESLGNWVSEVLSVGAEAGSGTLTTVTTETFGYDRYGRQIYSELTKVGDARILAGSLGIDFKYYEESIEGWTVINLPTGSVTLEKIITKTAYNGDFTKTVTTRFAPWSESIAGQQAIAIAREYIKTPADATSFIGDVVSAGLSLVDSTVEVSQSQPSSRGPSDTDRIKSTYADPDSSDQGNGYSTASESEMELITGNSDAKRRIEFSMPYAPDDSFFKSGTGYYAVSSDAASKARRFGEIQNRLLLGNRNGINIQTVPEKIPLTPFSPFYIIGAGTAALYRTNAISWTIDANGIIVSTDALYWGVAGKVT